MKFIASTVAALLLSLGGIIHSAEAEDYPFWPEFGTLASHNNWGTEFVKATAANQLGARGKGVKVAVLDEGLAEYDTSMGGKVIAYKNFLPGQSIRADHGTMAASLIAADYNPVVGIQGVAPDASLLVAKVCHRGYCDWEAIRKAVNWAVAEGAQVISMSFSGIPDAYMHATLRAAIDKGVVVVAALGNWGCNPYGSWGMNISCVQGKTTEGTQALYPIAGLIAAGASDQRGARVSNLYWSSSFGPNLDLLAPGIDISAYDAIGPTNGFGGTSAATPYIAGAAALILSVNPSLTPAQVQAILQSTAQPALIEKAKVWDACTKNPETNEWSCNNIVDSTLPQQYYTGAGVLDALEAVKLAKKIRTDYVLPAPELTRDNLHLIINWDYGPADLYINSELVVKNATSGYQLDGYKNQSLAVQLKQNGYVSVPAIAVLANETTPLKPQITWSTATVGSLRISVHNLNEQLDQIWWVTDYWNFGNEGNSALFISDTGAEYACFSYSTHDATSTMFTCEIPPNLQSLSGSFVLLGKSSEPGIPSDTLSITVSGGVPQIDIRSNYDIEGKPTFSWDAVSNARSYRLRYRNDEAYECIQGLSFRVADQPVEPRALWVNAYDGEDCTGNVLALSDPVSYVPLPAKPSKPSGITVKRSSYEFVEFEIANRNPNSYYRVYRSDGLVMRFWPNQDLIVSVQANEDVNNKTFTYRFVEQNQTTWADSWSELSDPIQVALPNFDTPEASCTIRFKNRPAICKVTGVADAQKLRIEYLDRNMKVISGEDLSEHRGVTFQRKMPAQAFYIQAFAFNGTPVVRNSWYRRGSTVVVGIKQGLTPKHLAVAY